MDRYIGLDVHKASTTVAVVGPSGKHLKSVVVETTGEALIEAIRLIPSPRHVCLEEGTQSDWLYEILTAHAVRVVVVGIGASRGPHRSKSDKGDAFNLANALRLGNIETTVYKPKGEFRRLRYLANAYGKIVGDSTRNKNRIKAMYRSRGISTDDTLWYSPVNREKRLKLLPTSAQFAAGLLFEEQDMLSSLKKKAEKEMLKEAKKHPISQVLETCPGLGPIRVAELLSIVVTPHRFRTSRQFWGYCGLGLVTRTSAEWIQDANNQWIKAHVPQTRGLNKNHNARLKHIYKGAATTVISRANSSLYSDYQRLLEAGTKPNLAKLTVARKIAAISLAMWKNKEVYGVRGRSVKID